MNATGINSASEPESSKVEIARRRRLRARKSRAARRSNSEFVSLSMLAEHDQTIASYLIEHKLASDVTDFFSLIRGFLATDRRSATVAFRLASNLLQKARSVKQWMLLAKASHTAFAETWRIQHDELRKCGEGIPRTHLINHCDSAHDMLFAMGSFSRYSHWDLDASDNPDITKHVDRRLQLACERFANEGQLLDKKIIHRVRSIARLECRQARVMQKAAGTTLPKPPSLGLPEVRYLPRCASVLFDGATIDNVDRTAAEALDAMCKSYPLPIGVSKITGQKAKDVLKRLPPKLGSLVYSCGKKGYAISLKLASERDNRPIK